MDEPFCTVSLPAVVRCLLAQKGHGEACDVLSVITGNNGHLPPGPTKRAGIWYLLSQGIFRFEKGSVEPARRQVRKKDRMTDTVKSSFPVLDLIQLRKYGSELFWVAAGQALALVGNVGAIKILIGVIGVDGYGELALGMSLAGFQNLLIYVPWDSIYSGTSVFMPKRGFYRSSIAMRGLLHGAIAGVTVIAASVISLGLLVLSFERWIAVVCVSLLFGIVSGIGTTLLSVHNALRNRRIAALHQGADVWLRTGFAFALTYLVVHGLPWLYWATVRDQSL